MTLLWIFLGVLGASFLLIVFRGAPFVPTRARDIEDIFSLHQFKKGEVLVDLGSGDGRVLLAAAKRGIASVGYELNPFLYWYSQLKLRNIPQATVRLEDFWTSKLPEGTTVVFVFLAGPFMVKLDRKLTREAERLGNDILLISYGMKIPGREVDAARGGFLAYRYKA
jgi:hypothetical protein